MKTIRMPKELAEKWLAALRSGEFRQGREALCVADSFCCLGVLQMVVDGKVERYRDGRACAVPSQSWLNDHQIAFQGSEENEEGSLLRAAQAPFLPSLKRSASGANDYGYSFAELADAIEAALEAT